MSRTVAAAVPPWRRYRSTMASRAHLELECAGGSRDLRSWVVPDWQVRDFPRRAARTPK